MAWNRKKKKRGKGKARVKGVIYLGCKFLLLSLRSQGSSQTCLEPWISIYKMQLWNLFQSLTFELWKTEMRRQFLKARGEVSLSQLCLSSPNTKDQHAEKEPRKPSRSGSAEVAARRHLSRSSLEWRSCQRNTGHSRMFLGTALPASSDLHLRGFQRQKWYFVFKSHCLHQWVPKFHTKMWVFTCMLDVTQEH